MPMDPRVRSARSKVAAATRWNRDEHTALKTELSVLNAIVALEQLVASEPNLTEEHRDRLAAVLGR